MNQLTDPFNNFRHPFKIRKSKTRYSITITAVLPFVLFVYCSLAHLTGYAQPNEADKENAGKLKLMLAGTFAKPKILPNLQKFAIAQLSITYKLNTSESVIGKEKSTGAMAGARLKAFLETTDGELTPDDFQEVTDYFYHSFQRKLKAAGIDTVAWDTITGTDFYKSQDDKKPEFDKEQVIISTNANNGNTLWGGKTGFAFGKAKRAMRFCDELGADAGYFYLTLDFADILLDVKINSTEKQNMFVIEKTRTFKYSGAVIPQMVVSANTNANTALSMLLNGKGGVETLVITNNLEGNSTYSDNVSQDPARLKRNLFAFAKSLNPVVIETTRAKYKEAAKQSLDQYADAFIAKSILLKK
ncbi:hypothetical protein [Niabella drilacis]|uniref:Uncharacterized protein n=1 Tax=Niabella drilacis (strain DSM 25811 / CCM 8410 / CCUG 62505 / LMG 26954 / E90) TaxID=1285928 RepID=A0A1G6N1E9_NIADE|nr:hypothetical protein [Niabella drilacis]SDC61277.1 hypothetical protein SAMN04487894_103104 [Niabella drilacis]